MSSYAQTIDDIEVFNVRDLHGSARFTAMGGAFTSLGNDISAIHINPAAAAIYRNSTFGMSLGFNSKNGTQNNFFGGSNTYTDFNLNLESIGYVGSFTDGAYKKEKRYGFGISSQKLANFNRSYAITGSNSLGPWGAGSLADYWLNSTNASGQLTGARGLTEDDVFNFGMTEEFAATQASILVKTNDTLTDVAFGTSAAGRSNLRYFRDESGSHNEIALSFGGEANKNFYYGFSLGFPILSYRLEDQIREFNLPADTIPFDASSYELNRTNEIYANGINLKFGFIYKPVQWWRIGASYQSPSWYSVNQVYEVAVQSSFSDGFQGSSEILSTGQYEYGLRTPAIYRIGSSIVAGKRGIISVDYEYSDPQGGRAYETSSFNSLTQNDLEASNTDINSLMISTNTIRLGAELRLGLISLRAGFSNRSSIYNEAEDFRSNQKTISAGIGYQNKKFGLNLSFVNSEFSRQDYVHPFAGDNLVNTKNISNNLVLGTTIRF